jgi:hypothetical protein
MGRSGKKVPARSPGTEETVPLTASTPAPLPPSKNTVLAPRERASIPRTTTDNPWRDLHPTRVWPD